jgi:hypothetical protein
MNSVKVPDSSSAHQPIGSALSSVSACEDETEIVAVITAAIMAYTGSGNFIIKNIVKNDRANKTSNWVLRGRQEAFDRRRVNRK